MFTNVVDVLSRMVDGVMRKGIVSAFVIGRDLGAGDAFRGCC